MRKCCCIFTVVLLLALVVIPAATPVNALGYVSGDNAPTTKYSVLQFDRINFFAEDEFISVPWPFNNSVVGSYRVPFDYGPVLGHVTLSDSSSMIYGTMSIASEGSTLNIYGGPQIINANALNFGSSGATGFSFAMPSDDNFYIRTVQIRATVQSLTTDDLSGSIGDRVGTEMSILQSEVFMTSNSGFYEIGDKLYEMLVVNGFSDLVYIESITLSVVFSELSGNTDTPVFHFDIGCTSNSPSNYFTTWVYQQNVPVSVNGDGAPANFFDWLVDSVESFLSFEIAPGLSITKIINLILVIGIFLWFITLLI